MSIRKTHSFQFNAKQIAAAAKLEAAYHLERAAWWNAEHEKAMTAARAAGVQVREYQVTGGKRAELMFDPSHADRLTEASNKRKWHQDAADLLEVEAASYATQLEGTVYALDHEDIQHFRLAGGPRES